MALKETISVWYDGAKAFEDGDFVAARQSFLSITDPSARILFNISRTSRINDAVKYLTEAITKDPHLAIAYYLRGLHYFTKKQYDRAMQDFVSAREKMHERPVLDYSQLGMAFKLYAAEVEITKASLWQRKGESHLALEVVVAASHNAEDDAMKKKCVEAIHRLKREDTEALTPILLPDYCIFNPPKNLTANLKKREYVAKSKVVTDYQHKSRDSSPNPDLRRPISDVSPTNTSGSNQLEIPGGRQNKSATLPVTTHRGHISRMDYSEEKQSKSTKTAGTAGKTSHLPPPPSRPAPMLNMNIKDSKSAEDLFPDRNSLFVEKRHARRHSHDVPREMDQELADALSVQYGRLKVASINGDSGASDNSQVKVEHSKVRNGGPRGLHAHRPPRPPPPGIVVQSEDDGPPPLPPRKDYARPR